MPKKPSYEEMEKRVQELERTESDRKKAEEALRESEQKYRTITSNIPGMIYRGNPDWSAEILQNSEAVSGYSIDEFNSQKINWVDLIHPDDKDRVLDESAEIKDEPGSIRQEYRTVAKDGSIRWVSDHKTSVFTEDGSLRGVDGIAYDITEQKRTEKKFEKLSLLKENLLGPGSLVEKMKRITDGTVDILGADFVRIWLIKPGDLCDSDCIHASVSEGPHVCRYRDSCLHLCASSGRYTHIDGAHRRVPFGCYKIGRVASGKESGFFTNDVTHDPRVHNHDWARELGLVSCAGNRLLSEDGAPIGVLALFSKKELSPSDDALLQMIANSASAVILFSKAMDALWESEQKFRSISASINDALLTINSQGNITFWNKSAEKIFGYGAKEVMGQALHPLLVPKKYMDVFKKGFERFIVDGTGTAIGKTTELSALRKNGVEFPVELSLSSYNADGHWHAVGTIRDISDRKWAEQEREKLILDLQKALIDVKQLSGLLPICSYCKKIRDDKGYWKQIESYIHQHSQAEFSHGICPDCAKEHYPEFDLYREDGS